MTSLVLESFCLKENKALLHFSACVLSQRKSTLDLFGFSVSVKPFAHLSKISVRINNLFHQVHGLEKFLTIKRL